MPHIHWVERQNKLEIPKENAAKNKLEKNREKKCLGAQTPEDEATKQTRNT